MGTDKAEKEYPEKEITEKITGIAFKTQNEIGPGFAEKVYQKVFENFLLESGLKYRKECYSKLIVDDKIVGSYRLDFLIEGKVVVELKTRDSIYNKDISQVLNYLKFNNIKVGLLLYFGNFRVKIKRLVL